MADAPSAIDDTATTAEDTTVTVDALTNDTDVDGDLDVAGLAVATAPAHGTATVTDGAVVYTPTVDYHGTDTFTYEVCDLTSLCDTATVDVTVEPVPDAPVTAADTATVDEDGAVTVDVLANDSDVDSSLDPAGVMVTTAPANGLAAPTSEGVVVYTPVADWSGVDTFTYQICDLTGLCGSATVDVAVQAVNDLPVATVDTATTAEDAAVTIDLLANDTDVDGDDLSVQVAARRPALSLRSPRPATRSCTRPIPATAVPTPSPTSRSTAPGCPSPSRSPWRSRAYRSRPSRPDDTARTVEDAPITVDVVANDVDADGDLDPSSVRIVTPATLGTAVPVASGSVLYSPTPIPTAATPSATRSVTSKLPVQRQPSP